MVMCQTKGLLSMDNVGGFAICGIICQACILMSFECPCIEVKLSKVFSRRIERDQSDQSITFDSYSKDFHQLNLRCTVLLNLQP